MPKRSSDIRLISRGWLLFMLLLAAAAPGCKKKAGPPPPPQVSPLPNKPQQVQAAAPANAVQTRTSTARKPAAAPPVQKQISTVTRHHPPGAVSLDFTNRRDPFRPFMQVAAKQPAEGKVNKGRVRDPLPIQSFDTEKFKVSGIITGLKENSALVIDPGGKGYVIKEGMQIGNNDGYVKRVTNSTVEVEESFRDDSGRVRKRLVKLTLIRKK
jgi:type IV pilus assembly protein PilP